MRTTAKALNAALQSVRDGTSVHRAAIEHNVAYTTLWKAARAEGITSRLKRQAFRDEVVAYYARHSAEATAAHFGIGVMTVVRWCQKAGRSKADLWADRKAEALTLVKTGLPYVTIAKRVGVHPDTLWRWRVQQRQARLAARAEAA